MNRDIRSRPQSMSDSPLPSARGSQPSAARRTSSWCTKNSTALTRSSMPGSAITDSRGGPDLMIRTRSGKRDPAA